MEPPRRRTAARKTLRSITPFDPAAGVPWHRATEDGSPNAQLLTSATNLSSIFPQWELHSPHGLDERTAKSVYAEDPHGAGFGWNATIVAVLDTGVDYTHPAVSVCAVREETC